MTTPARFWAVDFHVHTPGSMDARDEDYGTAGDIVSAAIAASLDAIAITDHNTAAWCDTVTTAAAGKDLIVLPASRSARLRVISWASGRKAPTAR
jgi:predicted metal-dependent phosphoesterase TrpH